jgi:hypothetical protein
VRCASTRKVLALSTIAVRCSRFNYVKINPISQTKLRIGKKRLYLWLDKSEHRVVPRKDGNTLNVTDSINRMLAIEDEIKKHEGSILDLRKEGQSLFAEFESWRTNLPFGLPEIAANTKALKREGKDDLKVGLKLALKRAIAKAHADGTNDIAATVQAVGLRFMEKRGCGELPTWVSEWASGMIDKMHGQQAVRPVAEATDETKVVEPPIAESPKATKKRKK